MSRVAKFPSEATRVDRKLRPRYLHSAESHLLPPLFNWVISVTREAAQRNSARKVNSVRRRRREKEYRRKGSDRGKLTRYGNSWRREDRSMPALFHYGLAASRPFSLSLSLLSIFSFVLFSRGTAEVAEAERGMQAMLLRQHPHLLASDALGRIHHVADRRVSRYHRVWRANILQVSSWWCGGTRLDDRRDDNWMPKIDPIEPRELN